MVSDQLVVDIEALGVGVVEGFFVFGIPHTQEWDGGDGECYPGFRPQSFVFGFNIPDDLPEIALGEVRLSGGHFEHPSAIFQHDGEFQRFVFGAGGSEAQLQLVVLVELQEVALDFLAPLDESGFGGLLPVLVFLEDLEELADSELPQEGLHGKCFFRG